MPPTSITVIVVNHNTQNELRTCLESLRHCSVVVFDNHSSDGSAAMVRRDFPDVVVIESETNFGYGAAANRAIQFCRSEYVVVANSDVIFGLNAVPLLSDYLDRNPGVGLMGPRLVNEDGRLQASCFPLPGSPAWLFGNDAFSRALKLWPGAGKDSQLAWDHAEERVVPWVKGAVLAIRKKAFDAVDGFDESFFMYYEEIDLCVRLANRGWQIRFAPVTDVVHLGGVSTAKVPSEMAFEFFTSSMRFATVHYSRSYCFILRTAWNTVLATRLVQGYFRLCFCRVAGERQRILGDLQAWKRGLRYRTGELLRRRSARRETCSAPAFPGIDGTSKN